MEYQRNLSERIIMAFNASPILLLTGARQTGKTTIVRHIAEENGFKYITFDDLNNLAAARNDPIGFLEKLPRPLIIDEVQRVPEIALPIKYDVDKSNLLGQFVLTGSANPLVVPKLNDSLAGRMIILNLWPLSRGELLGRRETFLDTIFRSDWKLPNSFEKWSHDEMLNALVIGGYPRVQKMDTLMRQEWCNSHLTTILERDVLDIANISRVKELPLLMQLLSYRSSNLLNVADVSAAARIPYATLTSYLAILEALFLIVRQPAWYANRSKRLTKTPKIYMTDTGILSYLLGATQETLLQNTTLLGQILENFIVQEIRKQSTWSTTRIKLYHFRTNQGVEVDLILEDMAGNVVGIEIKNSSTVRSHDFKGLGALAEEAGDAFVRGIVLYSGESAVAFSDKMIALPMSALWA
jgi:predicted AAA+ superfamily ATPase